MILYSKSVYITGTYRYENWQRKISHPALWIVRSQSINHNLELKNPLLICFLKGHRSDSSNNADFIVKNMNAIEAVTPIELSKAAALFGTMKQLRIQLKSADENTLDRAFEQHVQSVLEKLDQRLPALQLQNQQQNLDDHQSKQLLAVEVIMARHGLFDAAFQQVAMLCQTSKSTVFFVVYIGTFLTIFTRFTTFYLFLL